MSTVETNFNALLTKLDNDAGITDVNYNSTLALSLNDTLELPDDIMLPMPETEKEIELYNALKDYMLKIRQVLSEIESKLP